MLTDAPVDDWDRFFGEASHVRNGIVTPYRALIEEATQQPGPHRSLVIDYFDIHREDARNRSGLADHLIAEPVIALLAIREALGARAGKNANIHPRLVNLPDNLTVGIADVREHHLGKWVRVAGVVQNVSSVKPQLLDALYQCNRCGAFVRQPQEERFKLVEPIECYQDQGGCGRDSSFKLLVHETRGQSSRWMDLQVFQLQEPPDAVSGTKTPETKTCHIERDWCGRILPGDRITVNGILTALPRRSGKVKTNVLDYYIDANSFERETTTYADIIPTPEEEVEIRKLAASPERLEKLVNSFAPHLSGRREVKIGILLQLFGGVPKPQDDGRVKRGDIHILLVGDPGQGKSDLLEAATRLSPRGYYANAMTTTVAGLVGGVTQVDQGMGPEWIYVGGLAPMAHQGLLALDEADKPKENDLIHAFYQPLAQQSVSLTKMGARNLYIPAAFSGLIGCNPKDGRFDVNASDLASQLNLPSPLLDRMDLMFVLEDLPDEDRDFKLVSAILKTHRIGAFRAAQLAGHATGVDPRDIERETAEQAPALSPDLLKKYVAYARRTVTPILSDEARARITSKYVTVRRRKGENPNAPVGLTARYVESMVRISEAAARMRLSPVVEDEDMDLMFDIFTAGFERLAMNQNGEIDVDRIGAAVPQSIRDAIKTMTTIAIELAQESPNFQLDDNRLMAAAVGSHNIPRELAEGALKRLKKNGTLYAKGGSWAVSKAYHSTTDVKP